MDAHTHRLKTIDTHLLAQSLTPLGVFWTSSSLLRTLNTTEKSFSLGEMKWMHTHTD